MIVEAVHPDLMGGGAPLLLGFEIGLLHESGLPTLSVPAAIDVGFGEALLDGRPAAGDELAAFSLPSAGQSLLAELIGIETLAPVNGEQMALAPAIDTGIGGGETAFSLVSGDDGFCAAGWWWEDDDKDGRVNGLDYFPGEVDSSLRTFNDGTSIIRDTMKVNDKILFRHFDTATGETLGGYLGTLRTLTIGSDGVRGVTLGPGGVGGTFTDNDGIQYDLEPFPGR